MKSPTIRVKRPIDPLQSEIDRRIALKRGAERRETVSDPVVGTEALRVAAAFMRANPVLVVMEVRL